MASFATAKIPKAFSDTINLSKLGNDEKVRVRLLGEVHPAYRYWIPTREGKQMTVIAKGFNPLTQEWDFIDEDPLYNIPETAKKRKEMYYTVNCIDRKDGKLKILELKPTILTAIQGLAQNVDYGEPTDVVTGYDITITKKKTGPSVQNVKYEVLASRALTPLTDEEKALELIDLAKQFSPKADYIAYIKGKSPNLDNLEELNDGNTPSENADIPF